MMTKRITNNVNHVTIPVIHAQIQHNVKNVVKLISELFLQIYVHVLIDIMTLIKIIQHVLDVTIHVRNVLKVMNVQIAR